MSYIHAAATLVRGAAVLLGRGLSRPAVRRVAITILAWESVGWLFDMFKFYLKIRSSKFLFGSVGVEGEFIVFSNWLVATFDSPTVSSLPEMERRIQQYMSIRTNVTPGHFLFDELYSFRGDLV